MDKRCLIFMQRLMQWIRHSLAQRQSYCVILRMRILPVANTRMLTSNCERHVCWRIEPALFAICDRLTGLSASFPRECECVTRLLLDRIEGRLTSVSTESEATEPS